MYLDQENFLSEYFSLNHVIKEGHAYAIQSHWYQEFQRFLESPTSIDASIFPKIINSDIGISAISGNIDLEDLKIPQNQQTTYEQVYKLKDELTYMIDYFVVSQDVWSFLKKYYNADMDIIVFATRSHSDIQQKYFTSDNLEQQLIIPLQWINLNVAVVMPGDVNSIISLSTHACISMDILHFRTYIINILQLGDIGLKFCQTGILYFKNKKISFSGSKTFYQIGITYDMQIIITCNKLSLQDIEEEIETEGDELPIEQNLYDQQQFQQLLEQALNVEQIQLPIKSIQEIEQAINDLGL